jgi:uncharacterized membrane protein
MATQQRGTTEQTAGGDDGPGEDQARSLNADDSSLDNGRIISLSDGIFAFAMTLMVLQFDTPQPDRIAAGALRSYVLNQWPSLISYVISFSVVANYWVIHHRTFRYIKAHDMALIWINIFFLLCISFLPFPTDVLGEYHQTAFAVQFYALSMIITSAALTGLWLYLGRQRRLLHDACDEETVRYNVYRGATVAAVFGLSIPVAHVDAQVAWLCWLLLFPMHRVLTRSFRNRRDDLDTV